MAESRRTMTWVYFVRNTVTTNIKIGTSLDPPKRLGELQVGNDHRLELVHLVPGWGRPEEQQLHQQFAELRLRPDGEWFRAGDILVKFIGKLQTEQAKRPAVKCGLGCGAEYYVRLEGIGPDVGYDQEAELCPACRSQEVVVACIYCGNRLLSGTSRVLTYLGEGDCICCDCQPCDRD